MENTDIEIKPGLRVGIESSGLTLKLTIYAYEKEYRPINLSRAEAIQEGDNLVKTGRSSRIPIDFLREDAHLFGKRLMEIGSDLA